MSAKLFEFEGMKISYRRIGTGSRRVFFYHGFPGSSVQVEVFRSILQSLDLEAVCMDRPGYHHTSTHQQSQFVLTRRLSMALIDHLAWENFEVVSVSGGTPFLFDLVRHHAERISRVTVICGLGPFNRRDFPGTLHSSKKIGLRILPLIPTAWVQKLKSQSPKPPEPGKMKFFRKLMPVADIDQKVILEANAIDSLRTAFREALMQNGEGPKRDARAFTHPWSLDLGKYSGPFHIWHGKEDLMIPYRSAELMAKAVPSSTLHLLSGEGHYSLPIKRIHQIMSL